MIIDSLIIVQEGKERSQTLMALWKGISKIYATTYLSLTSKFGEIYWDIDMGNMTVPFGKYCVYHTVCRVHVRNRHSYIARLILLYDRGVGNFHKPVDNVFLIKIGSSRGMKQS